MVQRNWPFVDWLKVVGLALIVFGHVAAWSSPRVTSPVYQKQLGVAFFVFATGFLLSSERRTGWRPIYNRLFGFWALGAAAAIVMSTIGLALWGDVNESNYLPFAGGINVLLNYFPANPTTWYLGTYLHLLLVWAFFFQRRSITLPAIAVVAVAEIALRAVLVESLGRFVAYTFVGNWITVFALGQWAGLRSLQPDASAGYPEAAPRRRPLGPALVLIALAVGWPLAMRRIGWQLTFPFMSLAPTGWISLLTTSAAVSVVYAAYTLATYRFARELPDIPYLKLFSRNTPFVVIVHMPVYYLLEWALEGTMSRAALATLEFLVCFVALTLLSELLQPWLALDRRREQMATALGRVWANTRRPAESL